MTALKIILLLAFFYLAYEDFRYRAISYISLGILTVASFSYSIVSQGLKHSLYFAAVNLVLIGIQLGLTFLYFAYRQKQWRKILNHYIGSGDILFYIPLLFLFSPFNFVCIHLLALFLILGTYAIVKAGHKTAGTIPLAGGLAVIIASTLLITWNFSAGLSYDDMFIADLLYTLNH